MRAAACPTRGGGLRELYPDPNKDWKPKLQRFLLDSDARFDNFLFQTGRWARELWERFSMFMDRFHIGGWRRWVFVEPLSEVATMGAGGFVVMLALALPAFRETADDDWLKKSELAVTFLDRYGNEIGSRGIKHNDFDPAVGVPRRADQGDARDRRPPLLRAFRHRPRRHRARARHQHPGRRRAPGRLLDHPAAGEEPVPDQRAHHRAQDQGGVPRAVAGVAPDQERDPEALPRPRLSRRRRLRRRCRGAVLLQQVARAT